MNPAASGDLFDFLGNQAVNTAWQGNLSTQELSGDWRSQTEHFLNSAAGHTLQQFLRERLAAGAVIYPPEPFRALQLTPLLAVRVVILGQDPYHGAGQGEGLAFSVKPGVKLPPSLRNIFKERQRDMGLALPAHGSLLAWAAQGVLLLNTTLTVEDGQPASHAKRGWELLTDALVTACAQKKESVVFMLWGGHAQAKQGLIEQHNLDARHLVLTANHPSPLAALRPPQPFIGCGHFSRARNFLQQKGQHVAGLFE
jgi:uracil-DNA glycosylase